MANKNFDDLKTRIEQRACHICGSNDFEWGYRKSTYSPTRYASKRAMFHTRRCKRCFNIQAFYVEGEFQKQFIAAAFMPMVTWILVILFMLGMMWFIPNVLIK